MRILTAQEVKSKLKTNTDVKLVMTLDGRAFKKSHIPGSINITDIDTVRQLFTKNTPIIVYCSDIVCMSSYYAYQQLERAGFQNVWRFAGGLMEWEKAGYPLKSQF